MKLKDIYCENKIAVSLEVFPPKDDVSGEKLSVLVENLSILKKHSPKFISLTYGAGGTANNKSYEIIKKIKSELDLVIMPHFTCVNASKDSVKKYLQDIVELGIKNILALRGDIPSGCDRENFDFRHASDLISFITESAEDYFSIAVAGYPEGHIEAENMQTDFEYLKKKIQLGADAIFTQMFFDNDKFFDFSEKVSEFSPKMPVVAGIMPIISYKQIDKMLSMAKVSLPSKLKNDLEKFKDNPNDIRKLGIEFASQQCQNLIENGVKGLHFYTLNLSNATDKVLSNLGILI